MFLMLESRGTRKHVQATTKEIYLQVCWTNEIIINKRYYYYYHYYYLVTECVLAPFVGGSTSQQIPFVFLPLKGQIIHPSKDIAFAGIQTPVCAVSGAKFMTESGWVDLRNPLDADVPFRLFRDEGRTFIQGISSTLLELWVGDPDLRNKMAGRLVLVYLMCRELASSISPEISSMPTLFSPCVAFRIVGTPVKYLFNVSEVAFAADQQSDKTSSRDEHLSLSEYIAIGICSVLLGLIYVSSVFLYLHLRKRNTSNQSEKRVLDNHSITTVEEGIVKNNPLLNVCSHFSPSEPAYSDTNSSDVEAAPDIIQQHDDRKKHMQITSAMIHPQKQQYSINNYRSSFSPLEHSYQDSTTNERLPEENVSIVETLEGREERPDNLRALSGSTRKKLYFNPAYFELQLLLTPPPAALEFLAKIREVISIAKQKMASKRFSPSLLNIPEEENYYAIEPSQEFHKPASRRNSIISLKRENSRRKTCTGCPGCEPQDLKSLCGKLPEFPSLVACHSCSTETTSDSKQISIRKWLENVPILKDNNTSTNQDIKLLNSLNLAKNRKRLRSPTRSLPSEKIDLLQEERRLSPRPQSEGGLCSYYYHHNEYENKKISKLKEDSYYDAVAEDKIDVGVNLPPPDMIQQAMAMDKSEERVTTLTKKQMNAVINEFASHRNLFVPAAESPVSEKKEPVNYESDSLERSGRNKGYATPPEYAEVSSSQPSPSLSTALPDQEEMTMRNAIFNKNTGNMTISKINIDALQDDHDYELIVMKKGAIVNSDLYKLPELLQRNKGYSLVSEVYVNNGYNYNSAPSSPGDSNYSSLEKELKVKYEGNDKPGKLLIEVEDCPDHYIPVNDSDSFEPDTLDRKPNRVKNIIQDYEYTDSLERPHQILLRTTGSFKKNSATTDTQLSNFNRVFGSLREIYEAKTRGTLKETILFDKCNDEGRILTLEERHSKRQRAKGNVQPDVIPPPPHHGSPVYDHPKPVKSIPDGTASVKPPLPPKNVKSRSVSKSHNSNAPIKNPPQSWHS
ncbi:hypothetical protein NQ317_011131 [Molorchus minor]|uniref:Uncharacterized protein n=1 Tax=Molorchus minor TaxID=1323400 RepID=A0ABQ9K2B0_9CUCU|nr:hypothetical protein NQ317_011131 [Molorchus minor]